MQRALTIGSAMALVVTFGVWACSSDDAVAPGGSGGTSSGSTSSSGGTSGAVPGDGAAPEVTTTTLDPCRSGQPLPDDQHFVPDGMCARLVGSRDGLRQLMFAPNGDLFGTTATAIYLFRDADGDGAYAPSEVSEWARMEPGNQGNGNNAFIDDKGGYVYAGSADGVKRFAYNPAEKKGGAAEVVIAGQPSGGHNRRTAKVFDGWLYVDSGSAGNATNDTSNTDYDTKRAIIKRFDLSKFTPGTPFTWDSGEVVTQGIRNPNGFTRNETTKKMYAVVNGLDNIQYKGAAIHEDNPGEQIVEVAKDARYGYPFCFTAQRVVVTGNVVAPGTQLANPNFDFAGSPKDDAWCAANSLKPTTFIQAHSAPLDITFFDVQPRGALPEKWRGGAFVALHGSWNRSSPTGYKVIWQPFNADGTAPLPTSTAAATTFPYEIVFGRGKVGTGAEDGAWSWKADSSGETVRPAGVAVSPIDGALYIASDQGGLLYRVGVKR